MALARRWEADLAEALAWYLWCAMAPRKPRTTAADPPRQNAKKRVVGLPEVLPRREVLLACFYRMSVSVLTDRPAEAIEALRAAMPTNLPAARRRAAEKPLWNNVGVVHRSESRDALWFRQGNGAPYRVHPSRVADELRQHITVEEPRTEPRPHHIAEQPFDPANNTP